MYGRPSSGKTKDIIYTGAFFYIIYIIFPTVVFVMNSFSQNPNIIQGRSGVVFIGKVDFLELSHVN